jgi:hypothetical protein
MYKNLPYDDSANDIQSLSITFTFFVLFINQTMKKKYIYII